MILWRSISLRALSISILFRRLRSDRLTLGFYLPLLRVDFEVTRERCDDVAKDTRRFGTQGSASTFKVFISFKSNLGEKVLWCSTCVCFVMGLKVSDMSSSAYPTNRRPEIPIAIRLFRVKQSETKKLVFELLKNSAPLVLDVASTSMDLLERKKSWRGLGSREIGGNAEWRHCGLGWQKKGGREKLVSITKGRRDRNLFCKGELTSYVIMLVMMDVTPLW
jgi:hypothetical protein